MTQVPEGWYADPVPQAAGQPPMLRYWDGRQWTEHVHPAAPATQPQPYPRPYGQPTYGGPLIATRPGPTTVDGVPLAGWWSRVGAQVIDVLILSVAASVATLPLQLRLQSDVQPVLDRFTRAAQSPGGPPPDFGQFLHDYLAAAGPLLVWSVLINLALITLYEGLFLRLRGATPGKMALGIAVRPVDAPGQLPWSSVGLRVLFKQWYVVLVLISPWLVFVLLLWPLVDDLWPLGDKRRQALHEKPARTNVVRTR